MKNKTKQRIWGVIFGSALTMSLIGCGGGGGGGSPSSGSSGSPTPRAKTVITDTNGFATISNADGENISVQVTDEAKMPLSGISVTYGSTFESNKKIIALFKDSVGKFAPVVYFDDPLSIENSATAAVTIEMPLHNDYAQHDFENLIHRAKSYMAEPLSRFDTLYCRSVSTVTGALTDSFVRESPRLLVIYNQTHTSPSTIFVVDPITGFNSALADYLTSRLADASITPSTILGGHIAYQIISFDPSVSIFREQVEVTAATPESCGLDPALYGTWRYQSYNGFDRSLVGITLVFTSENQYRLNNPLLPCAEEGEYRIEGSRINAEGVWLGGSTITLTPGFNQDCSLEILFDFVPPIGYTVSGSTLEFHFKVDGAPVTAVFKR
jgi:hypothetical protein